MMSYQLVFTINIHAVTQVKGMDFRYTYTTEPFGEKYVIVL